MLLGLTFILFTIYLYWFTLKNNLTSHRFSKDLIDMNLYLIHCLTSVGSICILSASNKHVYLSEYA